MGSSDASAGRRRPGSPGQRQNRTLTIMPVRSPIIAPCPVLIGFHTAFRFGTSQSGVRTRLRHSAAMAWLERGVHIKAVADLLGHSSIAAPYADPNSLTQPETPYGSTIIVSPASTTTSPAPPHCAPRSPPSLASSARWCRAGSPSKFTAAFTANTHIIHVNRTLGPRPARL